MDVQIEKKRFSKGKITIYAAILILVIFIIYVIVQTSGGAKLSVAKERLSISTIKSDVFQENIPVSGIVLPITTIYLDAVEGGRVEEKFVEDGAMMKKGDPILRLSNTDLELSLINQETAVYNLLTQMQISQNNARQNTINLLNQYTDVENSLIESKRLYELNAKLYEKGAVGRQEYQSTLNDYNYQKQRMELAKKVLKQDSISGKQEVEQAKNSYKRTQSALDLMRKKVEDLVVKAPIDGQLTSLDAEIGQSKTKGQRLGQIDVTTAFKVIRLALSAEKQALVVPTGGFFQKTGGNWIFKVSEDGSRAYKVDIQLGSQNTDYYEIIKGLQAGDKVVTSSYESFNNIEQLILK
jgi:HlyD family secretion protein